MIIDGRRLASRMLASVRAGLARPLVVRAITVAPSPATESYLSIKSAKAEEAGMTLDVARLPAHATDDEVRAAVAKPGADAVIVQLPLPEHLDQQAILDSIEPERDADVLSREAYARFEQGTGVLPPVAAAIAAILADAGIDPRGMKAVVVGQGKLVGRPAVALLSALGAEVAAVTRESGDLSLLSQADIVVLGAGSPGLVKPEHLKPGATVIDAGTSEQGGAIVGDADPACAEVAGVFTPVPGGVGPVAVACLFRNAAILAGALQQG